MRLQLPEERIERAARQCHLEVDPAVFQDALDCAALELPLEVYRAVRLALLNPFLRNLEGQVKIRAIADLPVGHDQRGTGPVVDIAHETCRLPHDAHPNISKLPVAAVVLAADVVHYPGDG